MAKGDKKKQFMERTGKDETAYYEHSKKVCEKRHFNMRVASLLNIYGFDPLKFLDEMSAKMQPQEEMADADYKLWLAQDCECPVTLIRGYKDYFDDNSHEFTKEGHISDYLLKFPQESFRRFGDMNLLDIKSVKYYFDDAGSEIDVQAISISESSGLEIEPQDIIDFVVAHPKGPKSYKPEKLSEKIAKRFYQVTGMKITHDFSINLVRKIDGKEIVNLAEVTPF